MRARKQHIFHLLIGLVLCLAGCAVATPLAFTLPPTQTPSVVLTNFYITDQETETAVPTKTVTATQAAPVIDVSSTPIQFALQVCSPLAWETIPELFEIVSDPYKPPPPGRAEERHHGVDFSHYSRKGFSSIEGETVQAILPGVVAASIRDRLPYGNMVIIETAYSSLPTEFTRLIELGKNQALYVLYAHFRQAPEVDLGDTVDCGQKLGEVGAVGYNVVNAHLHMETRVGPPGAVFASMAFYTTTASVEEMENYTRWRTGGEFLHFDPMVFFRTYLNFIFNSTLTPSPMGR